MKKDLEQELMDEFGGLLAEKLDGHFPKHVARERGEAMVLVGFANTFARKAIKRALKEGQT